LNIIEWREHYVVTETTRESHSYYRTSIGSHMRSSLYDMVAFPMTLTDP